MGKFDFYRGHDHNSGCSHIRDFHTTMTRLRVVKENGTWFGSGLGHPPSFYVCEGFRRLRWVG